MDLIKGKDITDLYSVCILLEQIRWKLPEGEDRYSADRAKDICKKYADLMAKVKEVIYNGRY